MSTEDKIKATAKNIEGKAQELLGNVTGDTEMEAKGKAKQVQASAMHMTSKIKDKTKGFIDGLKRKLKIPKKLRIRF